MIDSTGLKLTNLKSDAPADRGRPPSSGAMAASCSPTRGAASNSVVIIIPREPEPRTVDFHYKNKMEDHNARIINDADGRLSIIAGQISATGDIICNGGVYAKKGLHSLVGNQWKAPVEFL